MARFLPALGCACALIAPTTALAAAPANDDFANAAVIPAAGTRSVIGTTAEATAQPFEPAGSAPLTTVWYSWTPAKNERVSIDTCALDDVNDADTVLDVFTGAAFVSLTMLATNDDDLPYCGAGRHGSHVVFNATANTPYSIRVDGYQNTVGSFTLAVSPYPSGGDLMMSAGELDFPNTPVGSMSPAQTLRLLNASATAMAFGKIAPSRDNYLIASDSCSNQTVAADGECSLHVRFAPQTAGYHFDFLSIAATNNPPLNGMATALPAGPTGPAGPQGQAGADGTNGKDGSDGAIGPVGPTGSSGAVGPAGPTGATGAVGPAGPVGASGPIGPPGPVGTAAVVRCKRHHKKVKCRRRLTRNRPKG